MNLHLLGLSFRSLGQTLDLNTSTVYRNIKSLLEELPHCADLSRGNHKHYSDILLIDGKYAHVKGYNNKIPVIYGLDYLTHDIVHFIVSRGENYHTCLSFFQPLRLLGYPLKALVCDDNQNFQIACRRTYPKAVIQICHNHYKETIRRQLCIRSDPTYHPFVKDIEYLFAEKRAEGEFFSMARKMFLKYRQDPICANNLIECFNSHLEGRLKTIKGFQSIYHAKLWLNAYFIQRRLKPFTGCQGKFKQLNGKCSLQLAIGNHKKFQALNQKLGL